MNFCLLALHNVDKIIVTTVLLVFRSKNQEVTVGESVVGGENRGFPKPTHFWAVSLIVLKFRYDLVLIRKRLS